jgi:hypothetical protein
MASRNVAALRLYRSILTTHRRVLPTAVSGWAAGAQGILSHTRQPVGLSLAGWLAGWLFIVCLAVCRSVCLSVRPSVYLSVRLCVCASGCPAVRLAGWHGIAACVPCFVILSRLLGGLAVWRYTLLAVCTFWTVLLLIATVTAGAAVGVYLYAVAPATRG